PDYFRWFLYEPEAKGAEITERNLARAKYDASYRITGNFLNWVTQRHDREIVRKLNAAAREESTRNRFGRIAPARPCRSLAISGGRNTKRALRRQNETGGS